MVMSKLNAGGTFMAHRKVSDHITLRRATTDDASALSSFAARCFQETFGPDNKPSDMEAYLSNAFSPATQAAEIADSSRSSHRANRSQPLRGQVARSQGS
jgi:hypothetical protein